MSIKDSMRGFVGTLDFVQDPFYVAVTKDSAYAYASFYYAGQLAQIKTSTGDFKIFDVGKDPLDVAVSESGRVVYVANRGSGTISVVDTDRNEKRDIVVEGGPSYVELSRDERYLYVVNRFEFELLVVDVARENVVRKVSISGLANGIAVNPHRPEIYLTISGVLMLVNTETWTVERIPIAEGASAITLDKAGGYAYIASHVLRGKTIEGRVLKFDISNREFKSVVVGANLSGIALSNDSRLAFITDNFNDKVFAVSTETLKVEREFAVGNEPKGVAISRYSGFVFVCNSQGRSMTVFDPAA
ncbi:YVTN family beta-propeller protein [Pseudomonas sp. F-14 TE3623]